MLRNVPSNSKIVLFLAFLVLIIAAATVVWRPWRWTDRWLRSETDVILENHSDLAQDQHEGHHQADEGHIDISASAARGLGLQLQEVGLQPFVKTLHVPAEIVEKPGQSGLSVTSPVQGVVLQIHRFPGQALDVGDILFTLRVADEALEAAQLSLLEILTKIAVTELEIQRLNPLAESGAIVGRRKLEMEYQLKQLVSERSARIQELKLRGLSQEQIQRIVERRELVNEIEVRLEAVASTDSLAGGESTLSAARLTSVEIDDGRTWAVTRASPPMGPIFTLELLDVFPGRRVTKGEQLCHIANHSELFIRGHAFESDISAVSKAMSEALSVTAETGLGDSRTEIRELAITYIDNHVDSTTQTFPFFLPLPNRVISEQLDNQGRLFRSWQFKPGQRAHLFIPLETWTDQIVLPRDAVVKSGPEFYAFRLSTSNAFHRRLSTSQRLARLERAAFWELEPVHVHVLHQDRNTSLVANDGDLRTGDLVVTSRAYQIFLAWKLQSSGGAGHGHEH